MSEPVVTQDEQRVREAIAAAARTLVAARLNEGSAGNVSARAAGGGMLITPSGMAAEAITPASIAIVDAHGQATGPFAPSSEWRFHLDLYHARPEAAAKSPAKAMPPTPAHPPAPPPQTPPPTPAPTTRCAASRPPIPTPPPAPPGRPRAACAPDAKPPWILPRKNIHPGRACASFPTSRADLSRL